MIPGQSHWDLWEQVQNTHLIATLGKRSCHRRLTRVAAGGNNSSAIWVLDWWLKTVPRLDGEVVGPGRIPFLLLLVVVIRIYF